MDTGETHSESIVCVPRNITYVLGNGDGLRKEFLRILHSTERSDHPRIGLEDVAGRVAEDDLRCGLELLRRCLYVLFVEFDASATAGAASRGTGSASSATAVSFGGSGATARVGTSSSSACTGSSGSVGAFCSRRGSCPASVLLLHLVDDGVSGLEAQQRVLEEEYAHREVHHVEDGHLLTATESEIGN